MNALYKLNSVAFDYGTDFRLTDINLEIERSQLMAIVGPNGSGKTSLLDLLAFFTMPTNGTLEYNGLPLIKSRLSEFQKTVAYVQQNPYLIRGTVHNNIELGLKLRHIDKKIRVKHVADIMSLLRITNLSDRYARSLSGGEAQKVAIAQVLILDPKVLVLDEPFTYLDKEAIHEFEQLLLRLRNDLKKTIIFTTHNQYQAQWLSDQVYSIVKGRVFGSQLLNLFNGHLDTDNHYFNTGKKRIIIPDGINVAQHIAIDPKQIVLSNQRLDSSMQNSYSGKIISMIEEEGQVKVSIDAGELFQAIVTHKALTELALSIGSDVWISFKSSSILVL